MVSSQRFTDVRSIPHYQLELERGSRNLAKSPRKHKRTGIFCKRNYNLSAISIYFEDFQFDPSQQYGNSYSSCQFKSRAWVSCGCVSANLRLEFIICEKRRPKSNQKAKQEAVRRNRNENTRSSSSFCCCSSSPPLSFSHCVLCPAFVRTLHII